MIALSNRELRLALAAMAKHHIARGTDIGTTEVLIQRGGNNPRRVRELDAERLNHFGWANVCSKLRDYLVEQPRILVIMGGRRRPAKGGRS